MSAVINLTKSKLVCVRGLYFVVKYTKRENQMRFYEFAPTRYLQTPAVSNAPVEPITQVKNVAHIVSTQPLLLSFLRTSCITA